jgi:transcription termination factor Rho
MNERRRPPRRTRGKRPSNKSDAESGGDNPYREEADAAGGAETATADAPASPEAASTKAPHAAPRRKRAASASKTAPPAESTERDDAGARAEEVRRVDAAAVEQKSERTISPSAKNNGTSAASNATEPDVARDDSRGGGQIASTQNASAPAANPQRDRGDRNDRNDRPDRNDRNDRPDRNDRGDRPNNDRGDRPNFDRGDRPVVDRGDRPPVDRQDRPNNDRDRNDRNDRGEGGFHGRNGRRHRRGRGRGPRRDQPQQQQPQQQQQQAQQPVQLVATGETRGWFEAARDAGFIRRPGNSYLAEAGDAYVPPNIVRQYSLRRADLIDATIGVDQRGRSTVVEIRAINDVDPTLSAKRPDFNSLPAAYPERKLFMETGRPAKVGHELTRRALDLIAPIGYGQRALIVAPARAGKTTILHAITEGVAVNHPKACLLILLVDERPEEVSEAISWGVGEVVSSSFDQPAQRHVEVTEMVLARAHRLVESGRDVVIVLDSLTRMARAHNTAERGTGRTLSGGLDATAMAKPKAFFGSARSIPDASGGGSLTIIATALVETGSRMDDVIFEEFKGTGNCEIKLDRSLAEKRIYPAIDIATSGTRREEKLFRADQIDSVYTVRRGLCQLPPQSAMEWLIKRILATPSNDALLAGL